MRAKSWESFTKPSTDRFEIKYKQSKKSTIEVLKSFKKTINKLLYMYTYLNVYIHIILVYAFILLIQL